MIFKTLLRHEHLHVCSLSIKRDCRVKVEEASVELFLRKLSPFPLGSRTEPELVLRKPGKLKITTYKGRELQDSASHITWSKGRQMFALGYLALLDYFF